LTGDGIKEAIRGKQLKRYLALVLTTALVLLSCGQQASPTLSPAPPAADFTASPVGGMAPLTVNFTDLSAGDIANWHWDFGDGQFSAEPEPTHIYAMAGNYTVSLAIMGAGGSDAETKVDYIGVSPEVISWEEAQDYIGQYKIVDGIIVDSYYARNSKGKPTFLNFHKPYEGYFKCVIWGSDRAKFIEEFQSDPETYFLNKRVRVTGLIKEYRDAPEIILADPSQIKVIEEQR